MVGLLNSTATANPGVRELQLADFRNYETAKVTLSPSLNVVVGANAQGKTNLLEALYLLSTSRLLRGMRDAEAIRDGAARATAKAELQHSQSQVGIILEAGIRKRATLNGMSLPRAADLLGRLPCVCISTADLPIVRGEPADRRLFLDLELSQLHAAYLHHLASYKRALEQRNALLRSSQDLMQPADLFEPWELQLAEHGCEIRRHRREFVAMLGPSARDLHSHLGTGESLKLAMHERDEGVEQEAALALMARNRQMDVQRGGTSVGPHRDDLTIEIGGRDGRLFGSQGQQRTGVIALKLATLQVAQDVLGVPPMLLLDDILSDLDERRRAMLVELVLRGAGQAVLTCTEADAAGKDILDRAEVFHVRSGVIAGATKA